MSVWFAIPTANAEMATQTLPEWTLQGYHVALMVDTGAESPYPHADIVVHGKFRGWAVEVNALCRDILELDSETNAIVTGGDDIFPCKDKTADYLEAEFLQHFPDTFGIMQPTGDGFCGNGMAAVSPWLGRAWVERGYGGIGPLFEGYGHFCPDSELWAVANGLGIYWERPDVSQYHAHWTRLPVEQRKPWAHLVRAQESKPHDRELFTARRKAGFPGSKPLK